MNFTIRRLSSLIILALLIISCGKKPVVSAEPQVETNPPPHWVSSKPTSSVFFHGIGMANIAPNSTAHIETARNNALSDLASEIEVRVSTNSVLYTLEREYKFESEFSETIRTSSDLKLEGFEITDTWEGNGQYWVFYRLNKSDYYAKIAAEKKAVLDNAADFYKSGREAWNKQQVASAFDLQVRALSIMKPYWAESNDYELDGQTILLDNAILQAIQEMANSIRLSAQPEEVLLNIDNGFEALCTISAIDQVTSEMLGGIPLVYSFRNANGQVKESKTTASSGLLNITINNPDLGNTYHELRVSLELEKLFDRRALDRDMLKLIRSLKTPDLKVPVNLKRPVFFFESNEQNLNFREQLSLLRDHLSTEMVKRGAEVTSNKSNSDIVVSIQGKTREGGESNGFKIALLDLSVRVSQNKGNKVYFEESENDIRGVSNTSERAGIRAFEKGREKMDRSFVEKVLNTIM